MTQKDVDRVLLVLYVVQEVGPKGSLEQMKGVCYILRNRVRAGWGEWMDVIRSAGDTAAHETEEVDIDPNSRPYQRLLRDVDDIYFGHSSLESDEGGNLESSLCEPEHPCLYWCFTNRPIRPQFSETIVRDQKNHASRATMGLMMFFT